MRTRHATLLSAAALLLMASTAASAYVLLSPARRWFPADLAKTVFVDNRGISSVTDSDHGVTAALGAVTVWNGGGAGNILASTKSSVPYVLGDGESDIIFGDPRHICTGTCLAATTVGYYDSSQSACCDGLTVLRYTDSDTAFNLSYDYTTTREPDGCSNEIYLEAVVSHEMGHLIGLAHSNLSSALMYASVSYCSNKTVTSDDVAGRDALYNCSSFTTGACGGSCTASGGSCTANSQCCSGSCKVKGKGGAGTCR